MVCPRSPMACFETPHRSCARATILGGVAMTHLEMTAGSDASHALPAIRKIGITDLKDALAKGIEDFWAVPTHAMFLSIIYPIAALVLAELTLINLFHLF